MRTMLLIAAAGALLAGAAQAKDSPNAMAAGKDANDRLGATAPKQLYVCSEFERVQARFSRQFGSIDFVTADQVRAARGQAWSSPKCITPAELQRLNGATLAAVN